jgi:phosphatidylserine/phosphatidylglycerophosphate/cardiolipin synthase-like enzyme
MSGEADSRRLDSPSGPASPTLAPVPAPPYPDPRSQFFIDRPARGTVTPPRDGTQLTAFIDYVDYYRAIGETLSAVQPGGVIVVVGWTMDLGTPIPVQGKMIGIGDLLAAKGKSGCRVRVMLSGHLTGSNDGVVNWFNAKAGCAAILDGRLLLVGCFHQKSVVAELPGGTVAFLGGMDFGTERLAAPDRAPWHDVQVKLEGQSAMDVFDTLSDRWTTHTDANIYAHFALPRPKPEANAQGCSVQVVKTYGNPKNHIPLTRLQLPGLAPLINPLFAPSFLPPETEGSNFAFAPNGNSSIHDLLVKAIQASEESIYIEDQYFVASAEMARDRLLLRSLAQTLAKKSFKHLIVLTCGVGTVQGELCQTNQRRRGLWDVLGAAFPGKLTAWCYKNGTDRCYWQHSKTWIFDDRFAVVGSANFNRRGLSHDGELGAGIMDLRGGTGGTLPFPHDLRVRLWMKHLSTPKRPLRPDQLYDFAAGAKFWTDDEESFLAKLDLVNGEPRQPDRLLVPGPVPPGSSAWKSFMYGALQAAHAAYKWSITEEQNYANQWDYALDPDGN